MENLRAALAATQREVVTLSAAKEDMGASLSSVLSLALSQVLYFRNVIKRPRLRGEIDELLLKKKDAALNALQEDFEAFKQKAADEEDAAWKDGYVVSRSEVNDAVKEVDPGFDRWRFS